MSAATFGNVKSPVAFVTTGVDRVPRDSLMSVTVAPGITPPCPSFTVPVTVAVVVCAEAGIAIAKKAISAAAKILTLLLPIMDSS